MVTSKQFLKYCYGMEMVNQMKSRGDDSEKCLWDEIGKTRESREKKMLTLPITTDPLMISRLELGTPI